MSDQLEQLFLAALNGGPQGRESVLRQLRERDAELALELNRLLDAYDANFLSTPLDHSHLARDADEHHTDDETTLPGFCLIRIVGEGGVARVFEADQLQPVRRKVAVKFLRSSMDSERIALHFEAERQALALMDHPAVCKLFDAGISPSGHRYIVMEFVDGRPLLEYTRSHDMTIDAKLRLFAKICEGVHHAHQRGLIHRDLKPSNILVQHRDGYPALADARRC